MEFDLHIGRAADEKLQKWNLEVQPLQFAIPNLREETMLLVPGGGLKAWIVYGVDANVILCYSGFGKLLDFAIAKCKSKESCGGHLVRDATRAL